MFISFLIFWQTFKISLFRTVCIKRPVLTSGSNCSTKIGRFRTKGAVPAAALIRSTTATSSLQDSGATKRPAVCPVKLIDGRHIPVRPSNIVIASWLRWGVAARQIARKGEDDFIAASSGLGERTFRFIVIGKAVDRVSLSVNYRAPSVTG